MQDRYTSDIGDFGKYGLLKELAAPRRVRVSDTRPLKLGVIWCRTLPEGNTDGGHTEYLKPTPENRRRFRACDPELYDALAEIIHHHKRCVAEIAQRGVLPPSTRFFDEILTFEELPSHSREARLAARRGWLERALDSTASCDLVFFDPDNGLPTRTRRHHRKGPKFIFYDELAPFIERRQALVVYQHAHRRAPLARQLQERFDELEQHFGLGRRSLACVFRRRGVRAFLIVPEGPHAQRVAERARACVGLPRWSEHFEMLSSTSALGVHRPL